MRAKRVDRNWDGYDLNFYEGTWVDRESLRQQIDQDVNEFLSTGGSIDQIPMGVRTLNIHDPNTSYSYIKQNRHYPNTKDRLQ